MTSAGLLPREFFDRPSVLVAPDLLGCVLEHETGAGRVAVRITEVEAYAGAVDPASHAYRGKTARNAVMFGPPGYAYVYFTYGMHFCVNLVCEQPGTASAVLLRAGAVIAGEDLARQRRRPKSARAEVVPADVAPADVAPAEVVSAEVVPSPSATRLPDRDLPAKQLAARDLARGPARLCQALAIDRALDGADVCDPTAPLRISYPPTGYRDAPQIRTGPRVGISTAADIPWRFWLSTDPTVSPYRRASQRLEAPGRRVSQRTLPAGRSGAWTEERGTSDEGRDRVKRPAGE